jgi:hypothetical protein
MSRIKKEKGDDNSCVAASDFVQLDQQDWDQEEQKHEHSQFGLQQNLLDWTMDTETGTGTTRNYDNDLKEQKLMITNLEVIIVVPEKIFVSKNMFLQVN